MSTSGEISCKPLFNHPELVRELVRTAIPRSPLELSGLRRLHGNYIADGGTRRQGDMVWRLQRHGRPPVYLLLEFQARPDPWMALRMQVYAGLLCQDLLRQQRLRDKSLPVFLPVVLYTGREPWAVPRDPGPRNYLLVDRAALRAGPAEERSVLAALLAFEQGAAEADLLLALKHINDWLVRQHKLALSQAVRDWIIERLHQQFPALAIPPEITLLELHAMLIW